MIEIENTVNWIATIANILAAIFILIKVNRISGILLLLWSVVLATQFYVLTEMNGVVQFEFIDGEVILSSPFWYKVLVIARSIAVLLAPFALYILAKEVLVSRKEENA